MAKVTQAEIIKLYDVILDRTPDAKGFAYWEGQAKSMTLDKMAELFFGSKEFKEMTKDLKPEALAKEVEKLKADLKVDSPEMNARVAFVEALIAKDKKLLGTLAANKTLESVWEGTDINEAVDTLANASVGFDIATLYVTILGRLPDAGGYAWYKNKMEKEGWTLDRIAKDFLKSSEFKKLYKTPEDFANAVETNKIFGKLSKEQKADLVKMATEKSGGDFVGFLTDNFDTFKDKAALASTFLENGKSDEKAIEVFKKFLKDGKADVAKKTLGITDDAPKATFKDDFKADATVSLTKDADALPEKGKDNSKNDLFKAVVSSKIGEGTLNNQDKIDGGAGTDKLEVELKSGFSGFKEGDKGGYLKNVEKIELENKATSPLEFNAKGVEGAKEYILKNNVNLTNLSDITKITLVNQSQDFTIAHAAAAVAGTDDTLELALYNAAKKDKAPVQINAAGIETLSLEVAGENFINNNSADATSVTVKGKGSLDFKSTTTTLTSFDASGAKGKVTADLSNQTALTEIKLGEGNDRVEITAATGTALRSIEGGAGNNDTVALKTTAGANVAYEMIGVENLEIGALAAAALNFDASNVDGLKRVVVTEAAAQDVALSKLNDADLTLNLRGAGANSVSLDNEGATVVAVGDGKTVATNARAVNLSKSNKLHLSVGENATYNGKITAGEAESVEVTLKGTSTTAEIDAAKATAVKVNEVAEISTLKLTTAAAESLIVNAKKNLTLDTASGLGKLKTLTVDTKGAFVANITAGLEALETVTINGAMVKNAKGEMVPAGTANLGAIGKNNQEHAVAITATDLAALTLTTVDTKDSDITVTTKGGTDAVTLGTIKVTSAEKKGNVKLELQAKTIGATAITAGNELNATTTSETASLGNLKGETITLDVTATGKDGATKAITTGTIDTAESLTATFTSKAGGVELGVIGGTTAPKEATITLKAEKESKLVAISADKLVLNLAEAKKGVIFGGALNINSELTLVGPEKGFDLSTTSNIINAKGESLLATFTGSATKADKVKVVGDAANQTITLTGDLGAGKGDAVTIEAKQATTKVDLSGLVGADTVKIDADYTDGSNPITDVDLTVNGTGAVDVVTVTGDDTTTSITLKGDLGDGKDTVTVDALAATSAVTIDVKELTNAEKVTIKTKDTLTDTIKLGTSKEVVELTLNATLSSTGKKTIEKFDVANDKIKVNGFTAQGEAEVITSSDSAPSTKKFTDGKIFVVDMTSEAAATFNTKDFGDANFGDIFKDGNGGYILANGGTTNGAKGLLVVVGKEQTHVYAHVEATDANVAAAEVTLVAVLTGTYQASDFTASLFTVA